MKLSDLLRETAAVRVIGPEDREIRQLVYDSRKDCTDALFVCISGSKIDAHTFLPQVAEKGAAAVVIEKPMTELPEETQELFNANNITVLRTQDARLALATLSAAWFGFPMRKMTTVGVTGTKGKTTSTHMLCSVLEAAGRRPGLIGTNGVRFADEYHPTRNTTPESYEIQEYAARMAAAGCDTLVMEVSSQGLKLHRVGGVTFDYGIFTNLSPDHIGENEHDSFEDYLCSKALLFRQCRTGILNRDDEHYDEILRGHTCRTLSFGSSEADYMLAGISYLREGAFLGSRVQLTGRSSFCFDVPIPGLFNVYNALSAAAAALEMGISPEAIREGLQKAHADGRMELVYSSENFSVLVDYAHNGISTETLLKTLRDYHPARLVVVFGCGGNRSKDRRYEMGKACGSLADLSVVTADNSRYEAVEDIIRDIHVTLDATGGRYADIPDRREAISYAIEHAQEGDIIAVIGKGHEDYQEVNGVRHHFLDREEIIKALVRFGYITEG